MENKRLTCNGWFAGAADSVSLQGLIQMESFAMSFRLVLIPFSAIALASCGGGQPDETSGGDISITEAAERAKMSAIKPQPGQYRVTMEVLEISIPGAPANIVEMMKETMAGSTHEYCLTQEDVDKGFEKMARQSQDNDDCSFERFDVNGGDFDAKMVCNVEGQGRTTMTMEGKGTPTSSVMDMRLTGQAGGMGEMNMHMKATHERIGDCS